MVVVDQMLFQAWLAMFLFMLYLDSTILVDMISCRK